ncbi:MAG TPA: aspartate/glutamate racemase family protein [Roseiarcus sp.]|jgi:Asp/Glu/hydantoin racemase
MTSAFSFANAPIVVINPNSVEAVTRGIEDAIAEAFPTLPVECLTIAENPAEIITADHVAASGERVAALVGRRSEAAGFVIACYAQPGLDAASSVTRRPVVGIQDAGVRSAVGQGRRFGVIALSEGAIVRHRLHIEELGALPWLAGEVALEKEGGGVLERLSRAGGQLRTLGAECIILGCAGFSPQRARLEAQLDAPVIDPTLAAVAEAAALAHITSPA